MKILISMSPDHEKYHNTVNMGILQMTKSETKLFPLVYPVNYENYENVTSVSQISH